LQHVQLRDLENAPGVLQVIAECNLENTPGAIQVCCGICSGTITLIPVEIYNGKNQNTTWTGRFETRGK
jgi:hypothetical protein